MPIGEKVKIPFATLASIVSINRLGVYREPGDNDFETIAKYLWNIHLSEALYPTLQNLEIGLRNSLHEAASNSFGDRLWFKKPFFRLSELEQVAEAERVLKKRGKPVEPGRIVAELGFGYWTALFDSYYDRNLINRPKLLRDAFRPMPRRLQNRRTLSVRFHSIRNLRNRVFHHERIIDRNLSKITEIFSKQLVGLALTCERSQKP